MFYLFERMQQWHDEVALVFRDNKFSYGQLLAKADDIQRELGNSGVGLGTVVVIEGTFSPNAVAMLLALFRLGAIAVPLTRLAQVNRQEYANIVEASTTCLFDDDDTWIRLDHRRAVENFLTKRLIERKHPGLVIFSSGSTGAPKAILHDVIRLLEKFRPSGPRKTTLAFLLFDHIGGLDTLFSTLANGGTLVTTPQRDPDTVCGVLARNRVHTLPASPTFLNLVLLSDVWRDYDLSHLQVIAYGSEPMPQSLLERLRQAFPNARLVQTYGMSELGVLRTRSRSDDSLWIRFKNLGFETKIVDGILWVRSESAMMGYINAQNLMDEDGWLNTEDAVEVDGEYLHILGRATDLVNVGGQKVYPAEVESVLLTLENVADATVYGEPNPLIGNVLAAKVNLVSPESLQSFKQRLRAHCRQRLPAYKIPVRITLTNDNQYGARLKKRRIHSSDGTLEVPSGGETDDES